MRDIVLERNGTSSGTIDEPRGGRKLLFLLIAVALVGGAVIASSKLDAHFGSSLRARNGFIQAEEEITNVPGTLALSRGYNLFQAKFFDAQNARGIGSFKISSNKVVLGSREYLIPNGVVITPAYSCRRLGRSTATSRTTSMSDLVSKSNQMSYGYDATTTVEASVPVGPGTVGASRDIRTALMFGNSNSQTEGYGYASSSYNYRASVEYQARVFVSRTHWDTGTPSNFFNFDSNFLNAIRHVNGYTSNSDRNARAFRFFDQYGSHVVLYAEFGAKCSKSIYLKAGNEANSYSLATSTMRSNEAEFFGMKFGSSSNTKTVTKTDSSTGVTYTQTSEICAGIVENNACNQPQQVVSLQPVVTAANSLPIWKMPNLPGMDTRVKNAFQAAVDDLVRAGVSCSNERCNKKGGKGECILKQGFWGSVGWWDGVIRRSYYETNCVCSSGEGADCTPVVPVPIYVNALQNILVAGGVHGGRYLSTGSNGYMDLFHTDDHSGRQRWRFERVSGHSDLYHIKIGGGTNHGEWFMSCGVPGNVDLFSVDDGSGRQRWRVVHLYGSVVNIIVSGGTDHGRRYLSVPDNGHKVDLLDRDDGSLRQRWEIRKL